MIDPAHLWIPSRRGSYGDEAVDLAATAGRVVDDEQRQAIDALLSFGPGGSWVALESGIVEARQNGKAFSINTDLLTTRGWVSAADIRVGDRVFHPSGHDIEVTYVSPVDLGRRCYRVTTTDGRSLVVDAEHLWTVTDKRHTTTVDGRRIFRTVTMTTQQMVDAGVSRYASGQRSVVADGKRYETTEYRFVLPAQHTVKTPDVALPVDPYLFGAWLGDGDSAGATLTCAESEREHWVAAVRSAGFSPTPRSARIACRIGITRGFLPILRSLGVLGNKHVPGVFLTAGTAQRLALLQGLMDTDGTISRQTRSTRAEFCSTREQLALGVLYLARSLGWRAAIIEADATLNGRVVGRRWRVCWTPEVGDPDPFRMERKASRVQGSQARAGELHAVSIKSIEPAPTVPVRCIKVDSPDGLFLAGRDLVPTHNSAGVLLPVVMFDLWLLPADRIVWTAHLFRTSRDAFGDFCTCIETSSVLSRRVKQISYSHGEESIELHSGAKLEFLARSSGGGRGLGGKRVVMDEALFLSAGEMGALMPVLSARPDPHINYGSSASKATSTHLHNLTKRGRKGGDPSLIWVEYCAPGSWDDPPCEQGRKCPHTVDADGCALDDETLWPHANHTIGKRITYEYVRGERRALEPFEFGRERLGWQELPVGAAGGIDIDTWRKFADPESHREGDITIGVDIAPSRDVAAVALFGRRADQLEHLQLLDVRAGTHWIVPRLIELRGLLDPVGYAMGRGTWKSLEADLLKNDFTRPDDPAEPERGDVAVLQAAEQAAAAGQMLEACRPARNDDGSLTLQLRHLGQRPLDAAVESARTRETVDAIGWSRKGSGGDITPLVAVTVARWLYLSWAYLVTADYDVMESVH